jgi:hypothetical protein
VVPVADISEILATEGTTLTATKYAVTLSDGYVNRGDLLSGGVIQLAGGCAVG